MSEKFPQEDLPHRFEISRELIEQIETLNLDAGQKGDIIFVRLGLKPSALISFDARIWHEGEDPHILKTEKDIEELYAVVRKSGLSFSISPRNVRTEKQSIQKKKVNVYHDQVKILVGANDEALGKLTRALESKDHKLIGRALGIPETAVEAFTGEIQKLNLYTVPKEDLTSEPFLFSPTQTLSRDNWRNEIQEGKRRADALRAASPKVYEEMMQKTLTSYEQQGLLSDKVRRKWSKKF